MALSNGQWQRWEYNEQGLKTRWDHSDGRWYIVEYNEQGLQTRFEDSAGVVSMTEYDANGKMTYQQYPKTGYWQRWSYDECGRCVSVTHSDSSKDVYFEYDAIGHFTIA